MSREIFPQTNMEHASKKKKKIAFDSNPRTTARTRINYCLSTVGWTDFAKSKRNARCEPRARAFETWNMPSEKAVGFIYICIFYAYSIKTNIYHNHLSSICDVWITLDFWTMASRPLLLFIMLFQYLLDICNFVRFATEIVRIPLLEPLCFQYSNNQISRRFPPVYFTNFHL